MDTWEILIRRSGLWMTALWHNSIANNLTQGKADCFFQAIIEIPLSMLIGDEIFCKVLQQTPVLKIINNPASSVIIYCLVANLYISSCVNPLYHESPLELITLMYSSTGEPAFQNYDHQHNSNKTVLWGGKTFKNLLEFLQTQKCLNMFIDFLPATSH